MELVFKPSALALSALGNKDFIIIDGMPVGFESGCDVFRLFRL